MSLGGCQLSECTFNLTHQCVKGHPVEECPHRSGALVAGPTSAESNVVVDETVKGNDAQTFNASTIGNFVLDRPAEMPRLPGSTTLGLNGASRLMTDRYTNVVGIVGLPASGKTACLVSTYLLLARGQFPGFSYADSLTLMAFEEIARGSRRWNFGNTPTEMTLHTEMADDREAGFLHLRLRRNEDGCFFDFLLPDLPGEWSKALIDQNDAARFDFLKSATVIWLMVDGRQFVEIKTRRYATYRTQCLIERLADILPIPRPRIILVPSWRDIGVFPADAYNEIHQEGKKFGMDISLAPIASFSQSDEVEPGEGLAYLIRKTLTHDRAAPAFWPDHTFSHTARSLIAFRSTR